jgi:hypothetical protein
MLSAGPSTAVDGPARATTSVAATMLAGSKLFSQSVVLLPQGSA